MNQDTLTKEIARLELKEVLLKDAIIVGIHQLKEDIKPVNIAKRIARNLMAKSATGLTRLFHKKMVHTAISRQIGNSPVDIDFEITD